jgi:acylglycerol lipase
MGNSILAGQPALFTCLRAAFFCLQLLIFCSISAQADVIREDSIAQDGKTYDRVYRWSKTDSHPKAVLIAVHGLILHGRIFEGLAKHLAEQDFIVLAPDLRGYGRWRAEGQDKNDKQGPNEVAYDQSRQDVVDLVGVAKARYPDIPLYCLGESLGADIVLYAASRAPQSIDGIILSSPAIEGRLNLGTQMFEDTAKIIANPKRQVNLVPYIKMFASEDPRIIQEAIDDPLVRKTLSASEIIRSLQSMKSTLKYADKVSDTMPVLVIQGRDDKLLRGKAVNRLTAHLRSDDQTVKWFKNRGHLMLETAYLKKDILAAVDDWLDAHMQKRAPYVEAVMEPAAFSKVSFNRKQND